MTEEQKFWFDLKGWLLIPGVLSESETDAIKAYLYAGGDGYGGPAQELLDHPVVVDVLNEILSGWEAKEDYYHFRCENSFITIRKAGWTPGGTYVPHVVLPPQQASPMTYQCQGGKIYSGLTRVVWELNPVEKGDGGTLFLSGTHKAKFPYPSSVLQPDNPHMESYSCPAGSVFIFTESLLHASTPWKNPKVDRVAIFNCYNSVWAQWHRLNLPHERIEAMSPKRQSLFRGVYAHDFTKKPEEGGNRHYALNNRAL
ncbi:MAG TPA: phytanoyl-CoA dioxygenase family protein [Chthonomonadaceae bacterium]|nr:phytanoyl-CoA dioxygenase family protein [Chthonomonadaceae bacterium]